MVHGMERRCSLPVGVGVGSVVECLDMLEPGDSEGRFMSTGHRVAMLGTGLIGDFYTMTLHGQRGRDRV